LPFNIDQYPYLKRILGKVYSNEIVYRNSVLGAHDSNWIREYELFYNKQPRSEPFVTRVFFKVNERRGRKAGFSHIRPVTDASEVSETYLIPPKSLSPSNGAYIKCLNEYNVYGETVKCTPYIMPESIFGMCIHASIWICLRILEKYGMIEKSLCIPDIQNLAGGSPYADKQGLVFVQATRLLRMCRASAFYIINKERPYLNDNQMLMELYAYVESGLPVIIGVNIADLEWWESSRDGYHSVVAIGYTTDDNKVDGFIFHDESLLPYQKIKKDELLNAWHVPDPRLPRNYVREMLVAVPPEVTLPFHKAYPQFETILSTLSEKGITGETTESLVIRPMLKPSQTFFFETLKHNVSDLLLRALKESNFPLYLWVFYLYDQGADRRDSRNVKGFFVRDATAKTELRFLYFRDEKQAIYQVEQDKVYRLREGHKKREKI